MLTLFINTVELIESIAISDGKKFLGKITWRANADESKRLLTTISKLLRSKNKTFPDLTQIVVDSGPGSFSALRIGVTVANTLAYALKISLYEKTTGSAKMKKVAIAKPRYAIPPHITKPKAE